MNNTVDIVEFWNRVKKLCKNNGMTQKELSARIGNDPRFIESQIFKKITPNIDEAVKIANIFGVSLNFLVTGSEVKSSDTQSLIDDIAAVLDRHR